MHSPAAEEIFESFQGDIEEIKSKNTKRARESLGTEENIEKRIRDSKTMTSTDELKELILGLKQDNINIREEMKQNTNNLMKSISNVETNLKREIENVSDRVKEIESKQENTSKELAYVHDEIEKLKEDSLHTLNKLEQKALDNNIIAFGIPSLYAEKKNELIEILNTKLDLLLTSESFESITAQNKKKENTCTYFLKVKSATTKTQIMQAIDKFRNKDVITVEDLFDNFKGTNQAGKLISFRNQITKSNQNILSVAKNAARSKKLAFAWEKNGKIFIRKQEGERAVEAISINHVNYIANST